MYEMMLAFSHLIFATSYNYHLSLSYFFVKQLKCFFSDDIKKPSQKVVLKKEACSRKEVANIENMFIAITMEIDGLSAPKGLSPPPITTSLIGAIELSNKDNLLALARF
jgi:hypothetical protein